MRKKLLLGFGGAKKKYYSTSTISITPSAGGELLTNGSFTDWVPGTYEDDPVGWTLTGQEADGAPSVMQVGPGEGHGGTGVGLCNFYSDALNQPRLMQTILTVGEFYQAELLVDTVLGGSVKALDLTGDPEVAYNTVGQKLHTWSALNATLQLRSSTGSDVTIDNASIKLLSNLHQLFTHPVEYGDFSINFTIPTPFFQAGVVFNYQDANNFARLYFSRINGRVYLTQRVSGIPSVIGSWSATYSAGKTLTARRHKNGTIDVLYNGATLASGLTATGLTGKQAGPFLTNAAGVTISNYTWDARSTT